MPSVKRYRIFKFPSSPIPISILEEVEFDIAVFIPNHQLQILSFTFCRYELYYTIYYNDYTSQPNQYYKNPVTTNT